MTWELWEYPDGQSFFPRDDDAAVYQEKVDLLLSQEAEAACVWTVETDNYDAAMQAMYNYRGWGKYRTIAEVMEEPVEPGDDEEE